MRRISDKMYRIAALSKYVKGNDMQNDIYYNIQRLLQEVVV